MEQKLLPAIRCWQQELKSRFPFEFDRIPTLLCMKPEEEREKDAYLTSIGITSPRRPRQRWASMFQQSLNRMQGKVAFLRTCGFAQAQVTSLIEQHPEIIQRAPECIDEFFRVISDMFGCAQDMDALFDVLLSCRQQLLFTGSPTAMYQNFTYFCTCIRTNDKEVQRAWKHGVFKASPSELDIRLDSIAAQLGAHMDTVKRVVRRKPELSTYLPATVGLRVTQLHDLGFSHRQVRSMCLAQPTLLTYSYTSDVQVAKWGF